MQTLRLFLLLGCLGFFVVGCQSVFGGGSTASAPTGTTVVRIRTDASADAAFDTAIRVLRDQGYALADADAEAGYLRTKIERDSAGFLGIPHHHRLAVAISPEPTVIEFSGTLYVADQETPIRKTGESGSVTRLAWSELAKAANATARRLEGELIFEE